MKNILASMFALTVLFSAACSAQKETGKERPASSGAAVTAKADVPIIFPFKEFPSVDTSAKPGEYILAPSYEWIEEAAAKGGDKARFIWYSQTMRNPGKDFSEVEFLGGVKTIPNGYIIPIPRGQEAKKGDIVVTWWQSGSGLERAIVVDDKNPAEPVVRYLSDGMSSDEDEKLEPNSFFVAIEGGPGAPLGIQNGDDMNLVTLIREAGDKMFVLGFGGQVAVHPKSQVKMIPLKIAVKPKDKVKAVWVDSFRDATVKSVDARNGKVTVIWDGGTEESVVRFGEIVK